MSKLLRLALRLLCIVSMALAGATACAMSPAYGVELMYGILPPQPPYDPTVVLQDFSYSPASPIHVGETLRFTAVTNHTTDVGYVGAVVNKGNYDYYNIEMRDDGQAPDDAAGDGVWRGELQWLPEYGTCTKALVTVFLHWYDYTEGQSLLAPKLTVLPEEDGQ